VDSEEDTDPGRYDARAAAADALVREGIALAVMAVVIWVMGPGRVVLPAWAARARQAFKPRDRHGAAVADFNRRVSEWGHEQTAKQDRRPAR
jgi:hypothetical protein